MRIFVSWSGELSRKIAEVLKKWIPCIIQSVEVFFSPEDIEKGDNWDKAISAELSECKYGIICLTSDNTNAPWVNFEAGAIAKTLDPKVTALMINIKPSDIRGPLARYQATKFEKGDFFQLIMSINKTLETPLEDKILGNTFEAMWSSLEMEANHIIGEFATKSKGKKSVENMEQGENAPIEEILQLLRKQNSLLTSPESIIPMEYIERIQSRILERNREQYLEDDVLGKEIIRYFHGLVRNIKMLSAENVSEELLQILNLGDLMNIFKKYSRGGNRKRIYMELRYIDRELQQCILEKKKEMSIVYGRPQIQNKREESF